MPKIGIKVAEYNPNLLPDDNFAIDIQYKRIKAEYQNMKQTATAYAELLSTSQL
jgi:hypothetical protein